MKFFPRRLFIGALLLFLVTTSCNLPALTPTPIGTIIPTDPFPVSPTAASSGSSETSTVEIPVTGMQAVSMQCQFCVNDEPHAVLLLPESASFLVSQPVVGVNCITTQVTGHQRIIFCRGAAQTTFTLNVCFDGGTCLQYPITLETCPLSAPARNPTPVVLTPINTGITPTGAASTSVPVETQIVPTVSAPPAVAPASSTPALPPVATVTALPPLPTQTLPPAVATTVHAPLSRGTPLPTNRLPRTSLSTPEGFLTWYFQAVWAERNYQDLWDNYLTPAFKSRPSAGGYEGYVAWWNSVQRVDVNSISVLRNDGTNAWVRVNVTFTMTDGRVISNQEYDYDLFFDATRQTWMFDYRTPPPTPQ